MNGRGDVFAAMRNTQAEMWPSASAVALVGRDYYRDGFGDVDAGGE